MQNINPRPSLQEVAMTFAENIGRFIELEYDRLFPRHWDPNCRYMSESLFKGHTGSDQGEIFFSKEGHALFRTYFSTRRDANDGHYLPRSLRLDGIRLDTVLITDGPNGKIRMFPNVPEYFKVSA